MDNTKQGLTLLELIIAVSLLGVIILAATTFDTAIRQSFRHTDIQAQLLTQVSPALQHMTKNIMQGIGVVNDPGVRISGVQWINIRQDSNPNSQPDPADNWVGYRQNNFDILFCPSGANFGAPPCAVAEEAIATSISSLQFNLRDNFSAVEITITACQDPDGVPILCGNPGNPQVTLSTIVNLRGASAN